MKRVLCVLVFTLLVSGCATATPGQKGPWDDFWKDLRGDNMEMRGFGPGQAKHPE